MTRLSAHLQVAVLFLILYVLAGWVCVQLASIKPANLVVVWLPSGIAIITILALRRIGYFVVFFAHLALNIPLYFIENPNWSNVITAALLSASVDVCQAFFATFFYQKLEKKYKTALWGSPAGLPEFWLTVCTLPVLVTTPFLGLIWQTTGLFESKSITDWLELTALLALGDIAGVLLLLPFFADWRQRRLWPTFKAIAPHLLSLLALMGTAMLVNNHLLVMILPVMLIIAVRHRLSGTNFALLFMALLCLIGTHFGYGGFIASDERQTFIHLQLFIFSVVCSLQYHALTQSEVFKSKARLEVEVQARTEALLKANQRLSELATTDELTQVPNRREWQRRCGETMVRSRRYKQNMSIIMLDIDHFKVINDQHGHMIGDMVLRAISQICVQNLRAIDTFARWGGEEFVVLLPDTDLSQAHAVAEKLRQAIAGSELAIDGKRVVSATVSLGVTNLSMIDLTLDDLLNRADEALYAAKANGRNCVITSASMSTSYLSPGLGA
jgi:diguanylate cyclase (GGDEF)-like protein